MDWQNFFIAILFILTIVFGILFLVYYNRLDQFKKDKELYLEHKETELERREKRVEKVEDCIQRLRKCESINREIRRLLEEDDEEETAAEEQPMCRN